MYLHGLRLGVVVSVLQVASSWVIETRRLEGFASLFGLVFPHLHIKVLLVHLKIVVLLVGDVILSRLVLNLEGSEYPEAGKLNFDEQQPKEAEHKHN